MPEIWDPQFFVSPASAGEQFSNRTAAVLLKLQQERVTGIAWLETGARGSATRRAIACCDGLILYAGADVPTPRTFIAELARYASIDTLDSVLEFAAARTSIQSVLRVLVGLEILCWPEIIAAARQQAIAILGELGRGARLVAFEPNLAAFDLRYEDRDAGFTVDALLAESWLDGTGREAIAAVAPANVWEGPGTSSGDDGADVAKPTVLVAEDSSVVRALVARVLGRDYEAIVCNCGLEAIAVLDTREDIALVLLDLTLPDIDGSTLCRALRGNRRYEGLPIVLLAGRRGLVERARAYLAGATHFLTKPVKPAELLAVVGQYAA